jgi:hypothetical protein
MDLNPETTTLLAKLLAAEAKGARGDLEPGEYPVSESVLLTVNGTVKVGADYDQRFVNKAKPWNLVVTLLEQLNSERTAAGKAGIDLAAVVAMAQTVDPKLAKDAEKAAMTEAEALKAPTLKTAKGKVTTKGTVEVAGKVTA